MFRYPQTVKHACQTNTALPSSIANQFRKFYRRAVRCVIFFQNQSRPKISDIGDKISVTQVRPESFTKSISTCFLCDTPV